jgi:hypothetical protein
METRRTNSTLRKTLTTTTAIAAPPCALILRARRASVMVPALIPTIPMVHRRRRLGNNAACMVGKKSFLVSFFHCYYGLLAVFCIYITRTRAELLALFTYYLFTLTNTILSTGARTKTFNHHKKQSITRFLVTEALRDLTSSQRCSVYTVRPAWM